MGTGGTVAMGMGGTVATGSGGTIATGAGGASSSSYDQAILVDHPVAFWAMSAASSSEPDLTGNANTGSYRGGTPTTGGLPNGDRAADFNGTSQYLTVPAKPSAALSIPTTGTLTWEGWIRPDALQFPSDYVDWMGKCEQYSPTCEWEARLYATTNSENRCNRMSAYAFNPDGNLGSGAFWQPTCGLIQAGQWYHVVGEYTTLTQPAACTNAAAYPGAINIWVNGVNWNQARHGQTGCMSQYNIVPTANNSAINIGTMAKDTWFPGAIGKVAIYDYLLSSAQITSHYQLMTGKAPTGSCADTCGF
jgi:hypothetical protein